MENKWIELGKYDRVRVNRYKGKYSIQMGNQGKEKAFVTWTNPLSYDAEAGGSVPAVKQDGSPLLVPLQIPLGEDAITAGNTIKALYTQILEADDDKD